MKKELNLYLFRNLLCFFNIERISISGSLKHQIVSLVTLFNFQFSFRVFYTNFPQEHLNWKMTILKIHIVALKETRNVEVQYVNTIKTVHNTFQRQKYCLQFNSAASLIEHLVTELLFKYFTSFVLHLNPWKGAIFGILVIK